MHRLGEDDALHSFGIAAEVILGLLEGDRTSYLSQDPDWQPSLPTIDPARRNDDFTMIDLLRFAEVA